MPTYIPTQVDTMHSKKKVTGGLIVGLRDGAGFNSWWRALKGQCKETC